MTIFIILRFGEHTHSFKTHIGLQQTSRIYAYGPKKNFIRPAKCVENILLLKQNVCKSAVTRALHYSKAVVYSRKAYKRELMMQPSSQHLCIINRALLLLLLVLHVCLVELSNLKNRLQWEN